MKKISDKQIIKNLRHELDAARREKVNVETNLRERNFALAEEVKKSDILAEQVRSYDRQLFDMQFKFRNDLMAIIAMLIGIGDEEKKPNISIVPPKINPHGFGCGCMDCTR